MTSIFYALCKTNIDRVDANIDLEVVYSCNLFAVFDSLTCPDIETC